MKTSTLAFLLVAYAAASLLHFVHNAELVREYPGLPATWTREGVYGAWLALSAVGLAGWSLLRRGYEVAGLIVIALYALGGTDSLGHYALAPMSTHSAAMNTSILLEVAAALMVLVAVARQLAWRVFPPERV